MMFNIMFIVILAVPVVLWVKTKSSAWTFVLAVVLQIGTNYKWGLPIWEWWIFWLLIIAACIALFQKKNAWFKRFSYLASTVALIAFLIVAIGSLYKPAPTTTVPAPSTTAHTTWEMKVGDYGNNRWFSDGIAEINSAKTDAEASNAANVWLNKVKSDPNLLVGAAKYLLNEDIDKATLTDKDGWATDKAVQLVSELQLLLGQSKIAAANAPSTGYNSGVENNSVVGASSSGISGNTKAVQVTSPNGNVVWVMARCGNIVTPGKTTGPTGKTDNESTPTTPTTPPTTPTTPPTTSLTPKSSNPNDYKQPGDGTETDSGTGTKPIVPTVTSPAEETPPAVTKSATGGGGVVDKPVNKPAAESGVTAPSATAPASKPTTIPTEPGVNPASGTNTGDIVNPFN